LAPAQDGGAFDEPAEGAALVGGQAFLFRAGASAFVFDVADGEPEQFDRGVVGREMPAILGPPDRR
jgi:hypothetical protein